MAGKIKINTTRLGSDADSVNNSIKNIKKYMNNMKEDVSQLDAMWDGPSSEGFKQVFQDDMNALNAIINNLNQIHTFETAAKSKYENCERKVSSLISDIKI